MDTGSFELASTRSAFGVNNQTRVKLTYSEVDGIAFAAERKRHLFAPKRQYVANAIGPLLELAHLEGDGLVESRSLACWLVLGGYDELWKAMCEGRGLWICSGQMMGFLRTSERKIDEPGWLKFVSAAEKAAQAAGFHRKIGLQLLAAIEELIDNIDEHSKKIDSGLAAFRAAKGRFEFLVRDRGIGVLRSLRQCAEFKDLVDHGDALQIALTDGCSRYGKNSQHGNGFRPLFTGLSNLSGSLRFRSGDHALLIDGQNPKIIPWKKASKPKISGFSASVSCVA